MSSLGSDQGISSNSLVSDQGISSLGSVEGLYNKQFRF